jgi:hypothetical protein
MCGDRILCYRKKLNERITEMTVQLVKKFGHVANELEVIKEKYTKFPP